MRTIYQWIKKETVLTAAWVLAILSGFLVPPDASYLHYIDYHTLGLLLCLMAVMAGLQGLGIFQKLGESLLKRVKTTRQLEGILVFLCFFSSMVITNDVALITFVPFSMTVFKMARLENRVLPVVAFQTIAANLGSMATPIGNPQNLYLYSASQMGGREFFLCLAPYTGIAFVGLMICLLVRKSFPVSAPVFDGEKRTAEQVRKGIVYGILFLFCMLSVAKLVPVWGSLLVVLAVTLCIDRSVWRRIDYSLLMTFVGFFLFIGNIGRIPVVSDFLSSWIQGREIFISVLASQVISNVPAALLLSGFTHQWSGLLIGTNIGGLGTLIASMASLISYKYIARMYLQKKGRYLLLFTGLNLLFLAVLLIGVFLIPQ